MTDRTQQIIDDAETAIRISDGVARLTRENDTFRRANEGLDKELWRLRDLLTEIDAELDRQLYDDPHVKSCRDNDLDVHPDCEHHVIIREALRQKITDEAIAEQPRPVAPEEEIAF